MNWKQEGSHHVLQPNFPSMMPLGRVIPGTRKGTWHAQYYTGPAIQRHTQGRGGFKTLDEAKAWVVVMVGLS